MTDQIRREIEQLRRAKTKALKMRYRERKRLECRNQANAVERRIEEIRVATPAPLQSAIDLMALTSRAADLFVVQPPHEKQAFLRLVLKSAAWRHGELQT